MQNIGEGNTAKIYREGNKVVKLYLTADMKWACYEGDRQSFAYDKGLPVPQVYGVKERDGSVALEMEYINGPSLLHPHMEESAMETAIEKMVVLQKSVHDVDAKGQPLLAEALDKKIQYVSKKGITLPLTLEKHWPNMDNSKTQLCHGDFHPLNILDDGGKLWIIDWVDATCGDPLADVCRTYLILKQFLPPMASFYLKTYCQIAEAQEQQILVWLPLVAAARLAEKLSEGETAFIMDVINGAM